MARLVFLGRLADVAGVSEQVVEVGALSDILARLPAGLAVALLDERVRLALNGVLVDHAHSIVLTADDELAFLPPVSGG